MGVMNHIDNSLSRRASALFRVLAGCVEWKMLEAHWKIWTNQTADMNPRKLLRID